MARNSTAWYEPTRPTLEIYQKLQPMQERIMQHMEREIDETEEGDAWKYGDPDDDPDFDNPDRPRP